MSDKIERPSVVMRKHLVYLDALRESGVTNMYGAVPWLLNAFPKLNREKAVTVLSYWMESFSERHPDRAAKR